MTEYMYDRILDVAFYRNHQAIDPLYKTCKPGIFQASMRKKQVYLSAQQPDGIIEFYKGRSRTIFLGYGENGRAKYKKETALGPLYTVRTLEEMKRGVTPQGNPFQTGDLVRVVEDNSLWNVWVVGSKRALYTETTYEVPESLLIINTPDSGIKPNISLDVSLIPGQNCYAAVLRISNLNLDPLEIRTWDRMKITAGYGKGDKIVFDCPIFASYIESPNPDGVVVFEGLTVGAVENVMVDKYIIINFVQDQMTLKDFIEAIGKGISDNLLYNIALGDYESDNYKIQIVKQQVYAQNGAAVLNWLQNFLSDYIRSASRSSNVNAQPDDVFVQLHDGVLDVILLSGTNKIDDTETVINLDMITGASFTGPSLNVIAPWHPKLLPGQLFYMPPDYFNGHSLPNSMPNSSFRTPQNLYRVITMTVEFATAENRNRMKILAMPAYNSHNMQNLPPTDMTADTYARLEAKVYKPNYRIDIKSPDTPDSIGTTASIKTGVSFIDENGGILNMWPTWIPLTQAEYVGTNMPSIIEYYLTKWTGGPKLSGSDLYYRKSRAYFKQQGNAKALQYFNNTGVSAISLWWPLAALGTFWKRQQDILQQKSNNWADILADNPEYITDGATVFIPVFTGWDAMQASLTAIRSIYKQAYIAYQDAAPGVRADWKTIYYYLGGTDEF